MSENGNARGALDAIFKIGRAWDLSEHEEAVILGQPAHGTLRGWKDGKGPEIDKETELRMPYVLSIL